MATTRWPDNPLSDTALTFMLSSDYNDDDGKGDDDDDDDDDDDKDDDDDDLVERFQTRQSVAA